MPSPSPGSILSDMRNAGAAYADKKPGAREQLLNLSHALISSLELPSESIQRMGWAEPARAAHCRIAVELKLFELLKESGEQGIEVKELAVNAGADEVLIGKQKDGKKSTEPDANIHVAGPSFRGLPEYLKSINYALPTSLTDGPFQAAHKTELPFFAWLDQNSPYLQIFNNYMSAYRAGKPSWVDPGFYPVSECLAKSFDFSASDVLLVDVGGGMGHNLKELKTKHPSLPGRLILQDRAEVILTVTDAGDVFEPIHHDFFTPQPVKSPGAYYLHSVLHDWGDDDCVKILEQLKPAMKPGYSKLLLNEIIVPRQNPTWPITSMDQLVFVLGAVRERTEAHWESFLTRAGFKVVGIYSYEMGSESLIEAEVA